MARATASDYADGRASLFLADHANHTTPKVFRMALQAASPVVRRASGDPNKLRPSDRAVHDWYRFVLSFPPHLVRDCLSRLDVGPGSMVLDPFCGTGTTLVERKKLGLRSTGIEASPMAHFATSAKVDWQVDAGELTDYADEVAAAASARLRAQGIDDLTRLPLFGNDGSGRPSLASLSPERTALLLKNSISPMPLHKTLVLLDEVDRCGHRRLRSLGRLALGAALVREIGNLKFGPEVGVGRIKEDAPVVDAWFKRVTTMADDLQVVSDRAPTPSQLVRSDARTAGAALEANSVDAVITSPPYPNEKDYTRTTRLESVILGMIRSKADLRALKQDMVRSNTRGVYKADTDDLEVEGNANVRCIADAIERRRIDLGKTSGFERMYSRVTKLYFGGMTRHLASLRSALKPGARLAYVVGDQASYLRVMIRTGQLLAEVAASLGYAVVGIDLFRTRPSTATGDQLREEVVLLEWPGQGRAK